MKVKRMEKKYMERLVGKYCKIVTKEPGENRANVVTGILEDVDYKDGFILVDSNQGLGCLRIDTIIAIKPGHRHTVEKKSLKKDDQAEIGIGVLIVFIASVLVAAVAASVIIQTSETLQQRAQSVGTQTIREVSSGVVIDDIIGYTNENKTKINYMVLSIRPRAGSQDIDLSLCELTILYNNLSVLTLNTSLISPVNEGGKTVFQTPLRTNHSQWLLNLTNNQTFGAIAIHDMDESVLNTHGINSGDRVYLVINLSAVLVTSSNWQDSGLEARGTITGSFKPEIGAKGVFDITAPSVFSKRIVQMW
jgi:archaeal flagellin FlaB